MRPTTALAAAVLAALALAACGGPTPPPPAAAPTPTPTPTFAIEGTMTVPADNPYLRADQRYCASDRGYDDIRAGAVVTVTDAAGVVLALGELQTGYALNDVSRCLWKFTVDGVPITSDFLGVEVSHRGPVRFTRDYAMSNPLTLTLG